MSVRFSFNVVDELIFHLDQQGEPWSVHCEVKVTGRLDEERVRLAARAASALHPLARARMSPPASMTRKYFWVVPDVAVDVPVMVRNCADDDGLADLRNETLSGRLSLTEGPPFTLALGHLSDGDSLILNLHHAAGDGMSAYRLMTSIARAYSDDHEDPGATDVELSRDLRKSVGAQTVRDLMTRLRGSRDLVHDHRTSGPPARIAVEGGDPEAVGYAFHLIQLDTDDTRRVMNLKPPGATANDVLLASLAMAVRRFNDTHDIPPRRITAMMPVNLRPDERRDEVVSNIVSFVPVNLGPGDDTDLTSAAAATAETTRELKAQGRFGTMIDLLGLFAVTPAGIRHKLHRRANQALLRRLDTTVLSNLGRIDAPLTFADAGNAVQLWFSPPAGMPLGTAIGAATVEGRLFLTIRYCRAQYDEKGAAAFAAVWCDVLGVGARSVPQ